MTKAEQPTIDSIIQDICELDNNPFEGMGDDDVWCSLSDLRVILERNFEDHRTASLAAQDGLVEALEALVDEQCDYMRVNNLGDPEKQHNIKRARAALAAIGE